MATVAMSIVDETMEKWQVSQEDDSQTIEQIAALPDFQELVDKYHGTQWNMNRTPDFRLTWSLPLAVFTLQVSKGIVTEAMAGDQQIPELIQMPFDTVLPILAKREP